MTYPAAREGDGPAHGERLASGTAVNVDAGIVHRLEAAEDSAVALFVLR